MRSRIDRAPVPARQLLVAASLALAAFALGQPSQESVRVADAAALVRAVADGGVVTVEPGVYDVAETLVLRGAIELRAEQPGTVRLNLAGAPVGLAIEPGARVHIARVGLAYAADAPGDLIRVRDASVILDEIDAAFAVAGGDATPERPYGLGSGLVATGTADVTVAGGGFGRHGGHAIEVRDRALLRLDGVVLVNNGAGVLIAGEAEMEMHGGEIRSHEGAALQLRDDARAVLASVAVEDGGSVDGGVAAVFVRGRAQATFDAVRLAFHPGVALTLSEGSSAHLVGATFDGNALDLRVLDAAVAELAGVRIAGPTAAPTREHPASESDATPDGTGTDR